MIRRFLVKSAILVASYGNLKNPNNQNVVSIIIRPNCSKYIQNIYYQFINSQFCKNQLNEHLTRIGVPNLHLNDINKTFIPLLPFAEQNLIVLKIEEVLSALDLISKNLE